MSDGGSISERPDPALRVAIDPADADSTADSSRTVRRYMVVETYRFGPGPVYQRSAGRGRLLPAGLVYVDSWIDARRLDRCFQLMETDDSTLFDAWVAAWEDLVDFEVVPVVGTAEAAALAGR